MYDTTTTHPFVKQDNLLQQAIKSEPISIVIVESHPTTRAALSKALSAGGIRVVANIADSQSTLQVACTLDPDLILYSVNTPKVDEMQRIMILRRELPNTLILVLVSGEFKGQESMVFNYGAHQVLSTEAHYNEIVDAVQKLAHTHLPSFLLNMRSIA